LQGNVDGKSRITEVRVRPSRRFVRPVCLLGYAASRRRHAANPTKPLPRSSRVLGSGTALASVGSENAKTCTRPPHPASGKTAAAVTSCRLAVSTMHFWKEAPAQLTAGKSAEDILTTRESLLVAKFRVTLKITSSLPRQFVPEQGKGTPCSTRIAVILGRGGKSLKGMGMEGETICSPADASATDESNTVAPSTVTTSRSDIGTALATPARSTAPKTMLNAHSHMLTLRFVLFFIAPSLRPRSKVHSSALPGLHATCHNRDCSRIG